MGIICSLLGRRGGGEEGTTKQNIFFFPLLLLKQNKHLSAKYELTAFLSKGK